MKKKFWDPKGFSKVEQSGLPPLIGKQIKEGKTVKKIGDSSGLMNTRNIEPIVNYLTAPGDTLVGDTTGAQIVFGRDRPASLASGYGGKGVQGCQTIDLVVGRVSSIKTKKNGTYADPNIAADAARIYISQMTDIDTNFGIAAGKGGNLEKSSAIGIKADGVRIVGRRGVKIVSGPSFVFRGTGPGGEKDSRGRKIGDRAPPIELIAGNYDQRLPQKSRGKGQIKAIQGVARGENTRDALNELAKLMEELNSAVFNVTLSQIIYNAANSVDPWRPWMAGVGSKSTFDMVEKVLAPLWHNRINNIMWQVNYTQPYGKKYVPSRNVFSTQDIRNGRV